MRIIQLLPTITSGDAVSNCSRKMDCAVRNMGYTGGIYAENISRGINAFPADELPSLRPEDIVMYHMSTGTELSYIFGKLPCRKVMVYHNITPPEFFRPYSQEQTLLSESGLDGLRFLRDKTDICIADSEFNRSELLRAGYRCPVEVLPVMADYNELSGQPDEKLLRQLKDGCTNILFTGRIAPNKKHEDIIRAFKCYKELDTSARLILAGSWTGNENYYKRLTDYVSALGLENVWFTGKLDFSELLSCYRSADIFLCMSAHEGFCVPLPEAMYFDIPVIALDRCAVGGTLGGSGVLLDDNEPVFVSRVIHRVLHDKALWENIISGQRRRLKELSYENTLNRFKELLGDIIAGKYDKYYK